MGSNLGQRHTLPFAVKKNVGLRKNEFCVLNGSSTVKCDGVKSAGKISVAECIVSQAIISS